MSTEFVFATAQYESGDWDSAQLVPPNIVDTIARYTEIAVAPTGVVVALSDDRMLRYPLLYLTGHLPVRFNQVCHHNSRQQTSVTSCAVHTGRAATIRYHDSQTDPAALGVIS